MEEKLTHFDEKGNAIMVDVTEKKITSRTATASGKIHVNEAVMKAVLEGTVAKGDVLGVARVAGIMAVKQTAHLIPMCHTLLITKCWNVIFHTAVRSVSETSGMRHRRCTAQSAWDCAISRKKPIGCCCSLPMCR